MIETLQLQVLLATFSAWVNRKQGAILAYLIEENRVLKEQLEARGQRLRLTDNQRRRLAAKGQPLGRRILRDIATIVSPDTILSWHRKLIAAKWRYATGKIGRPGVMKEIRTLILRIAEENPSWGYTRIQGALQHLDHEVARSTIAKVLKEHGVRPAQERPMKWRTFVRAHAHLIAAADFMDDPDREKPDGLRGWVPLGQAVPDPGPGRTVRAAVPGDFEGCERERVAHGIIVHRT